MTWNLDGAGLVPDPPDNIVSLVPGWAALVRVAVGVVRIGQFSSELSPVKTYFNQLPLKNQTTSLNLTYDRYAPCSMDSLGSGGEVVLVLRRARDGPDRPRPGSAQLVGGDHDGVCGEVAEPPSSQGPCN